VCKAGFCTTCKLKFLSFLFDADFVLYQIKGPVQCFSVQVVMYKCFLLKTDKKILAQIRFVVFAKTA